MIVVGMFLVGLASGCGGDRIGDGGVDWRWDGEAGPDGGRCPDGPRPAPVIEAVEPEVAWIGQVVTVRGRYFTPDTECDDWPSVPEVFWNGLALFTRFSRDENWSETQVRFRVTNDGTFLVPSGTGDLVLQRGDSRSNPVPFGVRRMGLVASDESVVHRIDVSDPDPVVVDVVEVPFVPTELYTPGRYPDSALDAEYDPLAIAAAPGSEEVVVMDLVRGTTVALDVGAPVACAYAGVFCLDLSGEPDQIRDYVGPPATPSFAEPLVVPDGPDGRIAGAAFTRDAYVAVDEGDDSTRVYVYGYEFVDYRYEDEEPDWHWDFDVGPGAGRMDAFGLAAIINEADDSGFGPGNEGTVSILGRTGEWHRFPAPGARSLVFTNQQMLLVPVRIPGRHEIWIYRNPQDRLDEPQILETGAEGGAPAGIAYSAGDQRAYVVDGDPARLFAIDVSGGVAVMLGSVEVPGASFGVAVQ